MGKTERAYITKYERWFELFWPMFDVLLVTGEILTVDKQKLKDKGG